MAQAVPLSLPRGNGASGWVQKGSSASGGAFASLPAPVQRREGFAEEEGASSRPEAQTCFIFFFLFAPCDAAHGLQG